MYVCSGCHDLLMKSTNLDDIAILNITVPINVVLLAELVKVKFKCKQWDNTNYNFF